MAYIYVYITYLLGLKRIAIYEMFIQKYTRFFVINNNNHLCLINNKPYHK